jgi:hypothetical protein
MLPPHGIGEGVHVVGRLDGNGVGIDAHARKVVPETPLHILP